VIKQLLTRFLADEHGQDLIEYALLAALIALAAVGGITMLGNALSNKYASLASAVGAS
jgi:pilus assembly protein Flp/PilA